MPNAIQSQLEEFLAELQVEQSRQVTIASQIAEREGLPFVAAYIRAGDIISAEKATAAIANGTSPEVALNQVGSYSRFDWAVRNLPEHYLLSNLPDLWTYSDPDDTCPQYLELWVKAWELNNRQTIFYGDGALPTNTRLLIYRGQIGKEIGISWTLSRYTATGFARTGGNRVRIEGGRILESSVMAEQILAYITDRNEDEVIVNPADLIIIGGSCFNE